MSLKNIIGLPQNKNKKIVRKNLQKSTSFRNAFKAWESCKFYRKQRKTFSNNCTWTKNIDKKNNYNKETTNIFYIHVGLQKHCAYDNLNLKQKTFKALKIDIWKCNKKKKIISQWEVYFWIALRNEFGNDNNVL